MKGTTPRILLRLALVLALAVAAAGCDKPVDVGGSTGDEATPEETTEPLDPTPTLALSLVERSGDEVVVELTYNPPEGVEGPRTAELWLHHSDGLAFEAAEAQAALEAAGKRLVVQQKDGGELRTIVFSTTDPSRVGGGPLVRYHFRAEGGGAATVELLERMPVFAPSAANRGLHLPEPLVVGGD
ncbi:MAG: hypothetical protein ACQEXJ_15810 [Myxococcota bacterium]